MPHPILYMGDDALVLAVPRKLYIISDFPVKNFQGRQLHQLVESVKGVRTLVIGLVTNISLQVQFDLLIN